MLVDIVFVVLMLIACFKGYSKGFIIALFSIIAFIAGLAAALKLSSFVAERLSAAVSISSRWLPFISFIVVFIAVVLLINIGARLIQKSIELLMLGFINRFFGMVLYALLYSILLSIFLFYAVQLKFLSPGTINASVVYTYIQPIGPKVINSLGSVIPIFKDLFSNLQEFFGKVPEKVK